MDWKKGYLRRESSLPDKRTIDWWKAARWTKRDVVTGLRRATRLRKADMIDVRLADENPGIDVVYIGSGRPKGQLTGSVKSPGSLRNNLNTN
jgi:hypothetical protein